jgi:hypothetical protein
MVNRVLTIILLVGLIGLGACSLTSNYEFKTRDLPDPNQTVSIDGIQLNHKTFAQLPTCNAATTDYVVQISDSTVGCTSGNTITAGGGTNFCLARCNGTNWVVE